MYVVQTDYAFPKKIHNLKKLSFKKKIMNNTKMLLLRLYEYMKYKKYIQKTRSFYEKNKIILNENNILNKFENKKILSFFLFLSKKYDISIIEEIFLKAIFYKLILDKNKAILFNTKL